MPELIAGKYEVIETVGRGGMGTVYKARQTNLDRIVAIKMLSEELAADPEFRARFQQEATVVARLNHPNIVQVHDIEPHQNTFCIIMEFVDGENLQAKIDRDVTLPEQEVMAIGAQVSRALGYAHTRGIIHRDIKPDNIHVTPRGVAKVMDFGIARLVDSKLKTQTGISMGTPKFMSPEQVTGKNVDGQSDLYSLGICLYYCVAGRVPFDGENAISVATRHLYEQPEPPSKINPSISDEVEKVILKALEKKKENRYATGPEMAEALEAILHPKNRPDANASLTGKLPDTTQKMETQGYGRYTTPSSPSGSVSSTNRTETASPSLAPLEQQNVPKLGDDFHTTDFSIKAADATRSFRRSLIVFGGLVFCAVILLIFLVIWLRNTDGDILNPDGGPNTSSQDPIERIEFLENETESLVAAGRAAQARNLWVRFQQEHPGVESARVTQELQQIEAQLPLAESQVLGERRFKLAFEFLNRQERAVAYAYLRAALAIAPELETSVTSSTMQNLQRKLAAPPTPAAIDIARQALVGAHERMNSNQFDEATQTLLVQAAENYYTDPTVWETFGDYYTNTRNIDGARIMYQEAMSRVTDPAQQTRLQAKIQQVKY